jgi:hypothetical protein
MEFEVVKAKEKPRKVTDWSQLFFNMSHELDPMNGILGFSSLLSEPGLSNEEQQDIKLIQISGAYA